MEASEAPEIQPTGEVMLKEQFKGKVVRTSLAGAVIDIGRDTPAVLHISQILPTNEGESVKRVEDVLQIGQEIDVWVKKVKGDRVELTMVKPLGLEWREIKKDMTVKGTVVRLEKFGVFVEIGGERPGLVHISEMAHGYVRQPSDVVKEGDEIEAMVLEVNRRKKQIKLSMKALQPEPEPEPVQENSQTAYPPRVFNAQPVGDRPARPAKKKTSNRKQRENLNSDYSFEFNDGTPVEAEPTAMEIALREAMEKAKTRKQQDDKSKKNKTAASVEAEDIFARTLGNKERQS